MALKNGWTNTDNHCQTLFDVDKEFLDYRIFCGSDFQPPPFKHEGTSPTHSPFRLRIKRQVPRELESSTSIAPIILAPIDMSKYQPKRYNPQLQSLKNLIQLRQKAQSPMENSGPLIVRNSRMITRVGSDSIITRAEQTSANIKLGNFFQHYRSKPTKNLKQEVYFGLAPIQIKTKTKNSFQHNSYQQTQKLIKQPSPSNKKLSNTPLARKTLKNSFEVTGWEQDDEPQYNTLC